MNIQRLILTVVLVLLTSLTAHAGEPLHLWSQNFGNTLGQYGYSVAVDGSGNVLVTGFFEGSVDFGGGSLTSAGSSDIFVAKFDASGNHLWSQRFGDVDMQDCQSVAVDGTGNVLLTGYYGGSVDFGGGALTSAGGFDVFVAKFDTSGNHLWSQRFGDADDQRGGSVAVDDSGNVLLAGHFKGSTDFGGGALTSAGDFDIFVAKFDTSGNHLWSQRFGDADFQYCPCVAVDGSRNVLVTGYFLGSLDFGGGMLTSAGDYDIFVAKLDAGGNHVWSRNFGDANKQCCLSVALEGSGTVLLTGYISGSVDFGGGTLTSAGSYDVFVAKFIIPEPSITCVTDVGNDQGREVLISFDGSGFDLAGSPTPILQYEAFLRNDPLSFSKETPLPVGPARMSSFGALETGWTFVGAVPAHVETSYSIFARTLADSTIADGMHWSVFFIRAATADPSVFFDSESDSGYSLDNLEPAAPQALMAGYDGEAVVLDWDENLEEDFNYYAVYRGEEEGFPLGEPIGYSTEPAYTDSDISGGATYWYRVTATDFSGNEGNPSDEASAATMGVSSESEIPTVFYLGPATPSPFNPVTELSYGIPAGHSPSRVTMHVYDATGREITKLVDADQGPGTYHVIWDGTDHRGTPAASGVYFYRLTWNGETETKRMVLLK